VYQVGVITHMTSWVQLAYERKSEEIEGICSLNDTSIISVFQQVEKGECAEIISSVFE
jgi:hypothetical protein